MINNYRFLCLKVLLFISIMFSCSIDENQQDLDLVDENKNVKACVTYFNIILSDFFEDNNQPSFENVLFEKPKEFDSDFYKKDLSSASFFVKLQKENEYQIETLPLFLDTSDAENGYSKFYFLNKINDKYYIDEGYSYYCDFSFLNLCSVKGSSIDKIEFNINPKPAFNTYNTNLFGTWTSDEGREVSFEEHYFSFDSDTLYYEKLGSYLLDKSNNDTLATIKAISMNNLILNCELINDGEMIYYKKTAVHPLSRK